MGRYTCPNWVSDGDAVGVDIEREGELEQLLPLVPVDLVDDLERRAPGAEREPLRHVEDRRTERRDHEPRRRTARRSTSSASVRSVDRAPVVLVDVPGVPLVREVAVQLQQVADRARRERLAAGRRVDQRHDAGRGRRRRTRKSPLSSTKPSAVAERDSPARGVVGVRRCRERGHPVDARTAPRWRRDVAAVAGDEAPRGADR